MVEILRVFRGLLPPFQSPDLLMQLQASQSAAAQVLSFGPQTPDAAEMSAQLWLPATKHWQPEVEFTKQVHLQALPSIGVAMMCACLSSRAFAARMLMIP